VEADLTVTRLGEDHFWVITGSAFIANDMAWLQMHANEADGEVNIRDITEEWACLALWGPRARDVLQKVTSDDVSNAAHLYLMTRQISINGAKVYAQRVSYAGELGWELYVPYNRATMVWDLLLEAGVEFGIEVGGYKVLDSLRLEKGYRYYTADVTQLETPYEAGLGFCVDLNKEDFIGKEALLKQKAEGVKRKLCTLVLDSDAFTQIYGGEAVYYEGKLITRVRSGGYGYTLKKNIFYAYMPIELAKAGTCVEVELIEGRYSGEVTATVLFDPKGERLRA
jgi:4-methylaminobutanoate oxidase (formaldehyde-forming)